MCFKKMIALSNSKNDSGYKASAWRVLDRFHRMYFVFVLLFLLFYRGNILCRMTVDSFLAGLLFSYWLGERKCV